MQCNFRATCGGISKNYDDMWLIAPYGGSGKNYGGISNILCIFLYLSKIT